jgi:hypothetical protein
MTPKRLESATSPQRKAVLPPIRSRDCQTARHQSNINSAAEYEGEGTIEAMCAKDADNLKCLI